MSTIAESLKSPSWWLSVVVASFVVNLLSAYAKPRLDGPFARLFTSWRRRVGEAAALRQVRIGRVRASTELQVLLLLDDIRCILNMIIVYAFVVGLVILAAQYTTGRTAMGLAVLALAVIPIGFYQQSLATDISSLLRDAGVSPWQSLKRVVAASELPSSD